jgi:hypothetical protein
MKKIAFCLMTASMLLTVYPLQSKGATVTELATGSRFNQTHRLREVAGGVYLSAGAIILIALLLIILL